MRTFYSKTVKGLRVACAAIMLMAANSAFADDTSWDFTSLSATDSTNLATDTENWTITDGTNYYFSNATNIGAYYAVKDADVDASTFLTAVNSTSGDSCFQHLKANGEELASTKGLYFGSYYKGSTGYYAFGNNGKFRVYKNSIRLCSNGAAIGIANLKAGYKVTFVTTSSDTYYLQIGYNLKDGTGFEANSTSCTATVETDGPVFVYGNGWVFIKSITITDESGNVVTSITKPNTAVQTSKADNAIYNLQGQRMPGNDVDALPSGIYIVNGKKIIK
jgi:hypothetical protein